jgi:hypothetical protein
MVDLSIHAAGDRDLLLPSSAETRDDGPNRVVALCIAADGFQCRRDVVDLIANPQVTRQHPAAFRALRRGVSLGEQQAKDTFGAEGADAQRRTDRAVYSAGYCDNAATPTESAEDVPDTRLDSVRDDLGIKVERRQEL